MDETQQQWEPRLGDRVRIRQDADDAGCLYPARFRAFRDARMIGRVVAIGDWREDPHPVTVDFSSNPLNPETMTAGLDDLEPALIEPPF